MGWGRFSALGNRGQQMDIEDQREEINLLRLQLRRQARIRDRQDLAKRVKLLERQNDELHLYLAALVRYLANKGVIQKEEHHFLSARTALAWVA